MASKVITVGPRALFDPKFVPPNILHRNAEEDMLTTILEDSVQDNFSVNVLLNGIKGVGKSVIINKTIENLKEKNLEQKIENCVVNCENKSLEELVISMVLDVPKSEKLNLNENELALLTLPRLWNIFKLICNKSETYKIFTFQNVENIDPKLLIKFMNLGKEMRFSTLSTINKANLKTGLEVLSYFDVKKKLGLYKSNQLFDITKQRFNLTFPFNIDNNLVNFIVDLVSEYDFLRPSKSIELMREIYPFIKKDRNIPADQLREHCMASFDSISLDEFGVISFISDADILVDVFLDNLSNHFSSGSQYYIEYSELKELYEISCESLQFEKNFSELDEILRKLLSLEVLKESNFSRKHPDNTRFYYLIMQPFQLKTMIDVIFGNKN